MALLPFPAFVRSAALILCCLAVWLSPYSGAAEAPAAPSGDDYWADGQWAHEHSDLQPDPAIQYATLPNGFRYAFIPCENPPGRVSVYLNVQAGAFMEEASQAGYAHFVEHMAFNGTRHFAPGELIPFFQKNGMSFGMDSNAYTTGKETVYTLNLAANDPENIATGLLVLRDFADGMMFEEKEVQEEIGVILAEKTSRDSEASQARLDRMEFLYPGTRFAREIIGTEESIQGATSQALKAFYQQWYRPHRMILVIAGDNMFTELPALVEKTFGDMGMDGRSQPPVQRWGQTFTEGLRFRFHKRPITGAEVTLTVTHTAHPHTDSEEYQRQLYSDALAGYCLNQRLALRGEQDSDLWVRGFFSNRWRYGYLPAALLGAVSGTGEKGWQKALTALVAEARSALAHGFDPAEVERAKTAMLQRLTHWSQSYPSMAAPDKADHFIQVANSGMVYTAIADDLRRMKAFADTVGVEEVNAALRQALVLENTAVYLSGNFDLDEKRLEQAWAEAMSLPVERFEVRQETPFPYLPVEERSAPVPELKQRLLHTAGEAPAVYTATLANGVELFLLPLTYEKGSISGSLLFGPSLDGMSEETILAAKIATQVVNEGGLGKLDLYETRQVYERYGATLSERRITTGVDISATAQAGELEGMLHMLRTQYLDPQIRPAALERLIKKSEQREYTRYHSVDGVDNAERMVFLKGDTARYRPVETADLRAARLDTLNAVLTQSRQIGPVRLFISGDFEVAQALELAATLFGGLPAPRQIQEPVDPVMPVFPAGKNQTRVVDDEVDKIRIAQVWRCDLVDEADRKTLVARQLAAAVLRERLRQEAREKLGAAYSPWAMYRVMANEGGFATLNVELESDTGKAEDLRALLKNLLAIRTDDTELARLKKPLRTRWLSSRAQNAAWERLMYSEILFGKPYVDWDNQYLQVLDAVSAGEVNQAIQTLFAGDRAEWVVISGKQD